MLSRFIDIDVEEELLVCCEDSGVVDDCGVGEREGPSWFDVILPEDLRLFVAQALIREVMEFFTPV